MERSRIASAVATQPWQLPIEGLALFEGNSDVTRLSHYFIPSIIQDGKSILFLDGANCADPRLVAKLTGRRGIRFGEVSRHIRIARAFTCFQLTELIARVSRFIVAFPVNVLIVTAFPELYFDEDVRNPDACVAFQQALFHLRRLSRKGEPPLSVAAFTSSERFVPPAARRNFLPQTRAVASELWRFEIDAEGKLALVQRPQPYELRAQSQRTPKGAIPVRPSMR